VGHTITTAIFFIFP